MEIGWTFLERAYWGGSYNGELKRLMLDHAFLYVDRVVFVVGEHNLRSQKALMRIGATFPHTIQRPARDGGTNTHMVLAITRNDAR